MKLLEKKNKAKMLRAVMVLGRFNPPHVGHYMLIDEAKKYIREHKSDDLLFCPIIIIIDGEKTSKDKVKNPLSAADREKFMKASGHANGCKFIVAKMVNDGFREVRNMGYEPSVIITGDDRADKYGQLLDKYFTDENGEHIEHKVIKIARRSSSKIDSAVDSDGVDIEYASSTLLKKAAELGYEAEFAKLAGLEDDPALAMKLMNKVKKSLNGENE